MHTRLRRARLLAGYDSARAAIERFGWKASTYRAHENGQNNFSARAAAAYARAFGVSSSWLLFGDPGAGLPPAAEQRRQIGQPVPGRDSQPDTERETARAAHFDLSLDTDDLSDIACRGDIIRFMAAIDHRALLDGDIVALQHRTETGVDILPTRVFFRHGAPQFAPHPAAPAETLVDARILGKAIWLLRRLAL